MVKYKGGISCEKIARFRNMDNKHFNVYIPINADNTVLSAAELFKSVISKTLAKNAVISMGGSVIKIGIIEESSVLKNWYIANGFVHTGTKKFDHLPFTSGYLEWIGGSVL